MMYCYVQKYFAVPFGGIGCFGCFPTTNLQYLLLSRVHVLKQKMKHIRKNAASDPGMNQMFHFVTHL